MPSRTLKCFFDFGLFMHRDHRRSFENAQEVFDAT